MFAIYSRKMSKHEKLFSVEIRLHCDCDSQWVTECVMEVIVMLAVRAKSVYKSHIHGRLAQQVEQSAVNRWVAGSSPAMSVIGVVNPMG